MNEQPIAKLDLQIQEATTLYPGDHLIVRVNVRSNIADVESLADKLRKRLPGIQVTFIVAEQLVIYRGSDDRQRFADVDGG